MEFEGTWDLNVNSPMGAKQFRMVILSEDGALQGTVSVGGNAAPVVNPRLVDGHLLWSVKLPPPMGVMLDMDLTRDGDTLKGSAKAGFMSLPDVSGARVP